MAGRQGHKQSRSAPVMRAVLEEVARRLVGEDESVIRIPEVCAATGVNYGSVYHHFGSREGVIDAAYLMMFEEMVERDVALFRAIVEGSSTQEEFIQAIVPLPHALSAGEGRRHGRAMRARIVAASMTRPDLRRVIGAVQARFTDELAEIITLGQSRGWLSRDFPPRALAVAMQVVPFGRIIDDVSATPVDQAEWEVLASRLMSVLVGRG